MTTCDSGVRFVAADTFERGSAARPSAARGKMGTASASTLAFLRFGYTAVGCLRKLVSLLCMANRQFGR